MLSSYPEDAKNIDSVLLDVKQKLVEFEGDYVVQKKLLKALATYCYSLGYSRGYEVGHEHGKTGKDDRVVAKVN